MAVTAVQDMKTTRGKRTAYTRRLSQLKADRTTWITHWQDLTRYILPRSGRYLISDRNKTGRDRYNSIYDNTGTLAHGVLSAGLMAGMTSPAQQWFKLVPANPQLAEIHSVRVWLDETAEAMRQVFSRSNLYDSLHQLYEDLSTFGTAVMLVLPDFENVIHCFPVGPGEYCLQKNYKGEIVSLYRECQKTVGEVVEEFGFENCSKALQDQWTNRELDSPVDLLHVIEPRSDQERDLRSPRAKDMPWKSVYLEINSNEEKLLRESGFTRSPLLAPRWRVNGGDVYGTSPGMTALGDIRQLQREQLDKGRAIAFKAQPPLQVPTSLKDKDADGRPHGVTYYEPAQLLPFDQTTPNGGIRTAFQVELDLADLAVDIQDVRFRINRAFHVDLFLMIANAVDTQKTKYEVQQLLEEKMILVGPVVQRLDHELLQKLIDIVFDEMLRVGALSPPPPELLGTTLAVELLGVLAQAQKAAGSSSMIQFINDVLVVARVKPEVADKVNFDKWVDRYAAKRGIPTDLIVPDDVVRELREARGRAQAQAEQAQITQANAGAAKDLAAAPTDQKNALTDVLAALNGVQIPA